MASSTVAKSPSCQSKATGGGVRKRFRSGNFISQYLKKYQMRKASTAGVNKSRRVRTGNLTLREIRKYEKSFERLLFHKIASYFRPWRTRFSMGGLVALQQDVHRHLGDLCRLPADGYALPPEFPTPTLQGIRCQFRSHTALMAFYVDGILVFGSDSKASSPTSDYWAEVKKFAKLSGAVYVCIAGLTRLANEIMNDLPPVCTENIHQLVTLNSISDFAAVFVNTEYNWNKQSAKTHPLIVLLVGSLGGDNGIYCIARKGNEFFSVRMDDGPKETCWITLGSGEEAMEKFIAQHPYDLFILETSAKTAVGCAVDYVVRAMETATDEDEAHCGGPLYLTSIKNGIATHYVYEKVNGKYRLRC